MMFIKQKRGKKFYEEVEIVSNHVNCKSQKKETFKFLFLSSDVIWVMIDREKDIQDQCSSRLQFSS